MRPIEGQYGPKYEQNIMYNVERNEVVLCIYCVCLCGDCLNGILHTYTYRGWFSTSMCTYVHVHTRRVNE